jgi:hypothetical protein
MLQTKPECYDTCNLQRLDSNVDLGMRHTNNALVKSNSVAFLIPISTHLQRVSFSMHRNLNNLKDSLTHKNASSSFSICVKLGLLN